MSEPDRSPPDELPRFARDLRSPVGWARISGWLGLALVACGSALAPTARIHWMGELACNVRWQLGLGALASCALLLLGRCPRCAVVAVLAAVVHMAPSARLWLPSEEWGEESGAEGPELVLASANIEWGNRSLALLDWIAAERPDVLALTEIDPFWHERIDALRATYPYGVVWPAEREPWPEDVMGIALLSNRELGDLRVHTGGLRPRPILEGTATIANRKVRLVVAHPQRVGGDGRTADRNATLAILAQVVGEDPRVVCLGDLNATEYSPAFRDLMEETGLRDSRQGFGRLSSWWPDLYVSGLGIAIDHVLVGTRYDVLERDVGPWIGSDHVPVLARVRRLDDRAGESRVVRAR